MQLTVQFHVRSMIALVGVYSFYVALFTTLFEGVSISRLVTNDSASPVIEVILLFPVIALAFFLCRYSIFMSLDDDWCRGLAQLLLLLARVGLFLLPILVYSLIALALLLSEGLYIPIRVSV